MYEGLTVRLIMWIIKPLKEIIYLSGWKLLLVKIQYWRSDVWWTRASQIFLNKLLQLSFIPSLSLSLFLTHTHTHTHILSIISSLLFLSFSSFSLFFSLSLSIRFFSIYIYLYLCMSVWMHVCLCVCVFVYKRSRLVFQIFIYFPHTRYNYPTTWIILYKKKYTICLKNK